MYCCSTDRHFDVFKQKPKPSYSFDLLMREIKSIDLVILERKVNECTVWNGNVEF